MGRVVAVKWQRAVSEAGRWAGERFETGTKKPCKGRADLVIVGGWLSGSPIARSVKGLAGLFKRIVQADLERLRATSKANNGSRTL